MMTPPPTPTKIGNDCYPITLTDTGVQSKVIKPRSLTKEFLTVKNEKGPQRPRMKQF